MKKDYKKAPPIKVGEWHGVSMQFGLFKVLEIGEKKSTVERDGKRQQVATSLLVNRNSPPQMQDFFRDRLQLS